MHEGAFLKDILYYLTTVNMDQEIFWILILNKYSNLLMKRCFEKDTLNIRK
jgi:hypothetical protein